MRMCDRCGKETRVTTMSEFNTEILCLDCADAEQEHPAYARAREHNAEAVREGRYNDPGIGLPDDY